MGRAQTLSAVAIAVVAACGGKTVIDDLGANSDPGFADDRAVDPGRRPGPVPLPGRPPPPIPRPHPPASASSTSSSSSGVVTPAEDAGPPAAGGECSGRCIPSTCADYPGSGCAPMDDGCTGYLQCGPPCPPSLFDGG